MYLILTKFHNRYTSQKNSQNLALAKLKVFAKNKLATVYNTFFMIIKFYNTSRPISNYEIQAALLSRKVIKAFPIAKS